MPRRELGRWRYYNEHARIPPKALCRMFNRCRSSQSVNLSSRKKSLTNTANDRSSQHIDRAEKETRDADINADEHDRHGLPGRSLPMLVLYYPASIWPASRPTGINVQLPSSKVISRLLHQSPRSHWFCQNLIMEARLLYPVHRVPPSPSTGREIYLPRPLNLCSKPSGNQELSSSDLARGHWILGAPSHSHLQ